MKTPVPPIYHFLGAITNGDMGPFTFYHSRRGRLVIFLKTWPKDPATYHQKLNRDNWRHAAVRWRSLGPDGRAAWKKLATEANLTITGYNLFMHYMTKRATATVDTLQRQTGLNVLSLTGPPLPYLLA